MMLMEVTMMRRVNIMIRKVAIGTLKVHDLSRRT